MNKNLLIAALLVLLAASLVWQAMRAPPEPWKPVLEETSFRYLAEHVTKAERAVLDAATALEADDPTKTRESLSTAERILGELNDYYLPLTEMRQLAYDADRLYFLDEPAQALAKLEAAREIARRLAASQNLRISKTGDDLDLMVEGAVLALRSRSEQTGQKLRDLGHKVNLLALKGELELAD